METTKPKTLIKIYDGEIYKIYTKGDEVLTIYSDEGSLDNPIDENTPFELFCFNSSDYDTLIQMDEDKFETYLEELGDDLLYTFKVTIVDYSSAYLYCAVVIKKSDLAKAEITFNSYEEQTDFIDSVKLDVKRYEQWMNGYGLTACHHSKGDDVWFDCYFKSDIFNYLNSKEDDWIELKNPNIGRYLEI